MDANPHLLSWQWVTEQWKPIRARLGEAPSPEAAVLFADADVPRRLLDRRGAHAVDPRDLLQALELDAVWRQLRIDTFVHRRDVGVELIDSA